jgi:hypothetical protein
VDSGVNALPRSRVSYRGDATDYSGGCLDRFREDDPVFSDDPLLIAYAISEQAMAVLGPAFWMLLA